MKEIAIYSLKSCQEHIQNRKNSSEVYGYDFCIDENYNIWLIEINSSPSMDFSSDITEKLVKQMSDDYIKVVIDHGLASRKRQKNISTGLFSCIHKSKTAVSNAKELVGINFRVESNGLTKNQLNKMKNEI